MPDLAPKSRPSFVQAVVGTAHLIWARQLVFYRECRVLDKFIYRLDCQVIYSRFSLDNTGRKKNLLPKTSVRSFFQTNYEVDKFAICENTPNAHVWLQDLHF